MPTFVYVYLDGDSIGERLELLLLDNRVDEAAALSKAISSGIDNMRKRLLQIPDASLIFCGGDDLLAKLPENQSLRSEIEAIRIKFLAESGFTISGGIGETAKEAAENLRRAKLSGKNRVA
jgi:GTP cyclohydrolase III